MRIEKKDKTRIFTVGIDKNISIADCGNIELEVDEQVTFLTKSGREYDVVAKSWGFYAAPSLNGRLKNEGFKSALVKNRDGRVYLLLVEEDKVKEFEQYIKDEMLQIERWLDE